MSTRSRVPDHTSAEINEKIAQRTRENIEFYARNPEQIELRLAELDREWDIERTLETNSATLSLLGLALGFTVHPRWFLIPVAVQTFFLQHALQGWCPPLPVLRRLGVRTLDEINYERYALKALRGDFEGVGTEQPELTPRKTADEIITAVVH